jgi:single-stranded DNA-binding protein
MNQFTFKGQIIGIETKTTQAGKTFATFTVAAPDSYNPQKVLNVKMTAFGKASEEVLALGEFATCTVTGKLDSREWQGKHYIDLKAMSVTAAV